MRIDRLVALLSRPLQHRSDRRRRRPGAQVSFAAAISAGMSSISFPTVSPFDHDRSVGSGDEFIPPPEERHYQSDACYAANRDTSHHAYIV